MRPALGQALWAASVVAVLAGSNARAGNEIDGRALYRGYVAFSAGNDATANRLPAGFAACANCHGDLAQGGRESALTVPPIAWADLIATSEGQASYGSAAEVLRAISEGKGRGGRALSAAMPRYRLSAQEASALVNYLRRAGTRGDAPVGVASEAIRLGTLLPLTGPAAVAGRNVLAGLNDRLDAINAAGGVHGRRLTLVAADAGDVGAVERVFDAPVFALVGSLWPGGSKTFESLLARRRVANLGSLVVRARAADATDWDLDLLPPLDVQLTALEAALGGCGGDRWAVSLPGAPPPGASSIHWIADAGRLGAPLAGSCLGGALSSAGPILDGRAAGWRKMIVSPLPRPLLPSTAADAGSVWRRLGRAAAAVAVELLSQAGPVLSERSALDLAHRLNGFEPTPGAPARFGPGRRYAWDPEMIAFDRSSDRRNVRQPASPPPEKGVDP